MKTKPDYTGMAAKRVTIKGKRMVMLDEAAYEALVRKADMWEPDLPAPDTEGRLWPTNKNPALPAQLGQNGAGRNPP
jgi:hypothetical protein